ncbi:radical SAM protein [Enterococcus sp. CWB-B31]|uniref:radical SAM protein n=1 Tax=Enterococcus sp. CWB-B31 TaxID=2885159 RepID=UPI001E3F194F|nr:radical SAM protein [Enterococcus sp. CWB-B31]MCB5956346.1 4Fe-4S cluster-binding domain-containing protein [Enterococcus sp. CWB-B31]
MKRPNIITAAILTTDKCSAACKECYFQCTPKNNNRLNLDKMKLFIDELVNDFHEINCVVFTGGECFLLKEDLYSIIECASSKGLATRCVTNGFWGKNKKKAIEIIKRLKQCGLVELNFSTGDNHQEWVPFQSVVNAPLSALQLDIPVVISVETHSSTIFKIEDVYKNTEIEEFMKNLNYLM